MTTRKKNLEDYSNALGFEVPAGATQKQSVEGEPKPDHDEVHEAEFTDLPEHSNDALPVHKRSMPKVVLAITAVTMLFGLPAYLFLSAASGGGGAPNVVKADSKDKKTDLKDPQSDEINRLKTDLAVGKQLASTSPSPSPSPSTTPAPAPDDKTTAAKPSPSPTTTPSVAPTAPTPPVVAKTNPQAAAPVTPVAPVQPKPLAPVAQQPVAKPIVAPAPKAIAYAPSTPPVKAAAPMVAKPEPKAIAKSEPKPEVKPATPPVKPEPKAIAKSEPKPEVKPEPKAPLAVASNPTSATTPISWEQASAAGVYGGDPASVMPPPVGGLGTAGAKDAGKDSGKQQRSSYEGAMSPQLLLAAGVNAKGHTLAPYTVGISKEQSDAMPLSIALDEPIELDKGYRLPVGTVVNFVASVRDNGSVAAVSKNADIGGVEIQLPEGAITLVSDNNGLLLTKEVSTGDGDLARADMNSSIWGGVAGAGRAILQSGGQTTTNTGLLGTTTTQTNNGSPNIIGGVLDGAFTPLATNGQQRAQETAERIQQRSKLNTIDVNTKVKLFVNASIQVQIPVSGQQVGQVAEEQEELPPPPRLITSNSVQSSTANELPSQQMSVAPQSATQTPLPAVVAPAPAQPVAVPPQRPQTPVLPKQSITTTPPLNPSKTRISTTW